MSSFIDFIGPYLPERFKLARMHWWRHRELRFFIYPRTFNQFVNQTMLKRDTKLLTLTADKFAVRAWVAEIVGEQYLIPLLGVIERAEDLDFEALPEAFIMKATHGSGMNFIVRDKRTVSADQLRERIREWMKVDYAAFANERHYRDIPRRVIFEELLIDDGGLPPADYKLWVFHQKTAMVQAIDRADGNTRAFLTPDWKELTLEQVLPPGPPLARPEKMDEMLAVAEKLAAGFTFVRVDMYFYRGRVLFGEMTHTPAAGRDPFTPREFDHVLGTIWRKGGAIPEKYYARPAQR